MSGPAPTIGFDQRLFERAKGGDAPALGELLERQRGKIERMVAVRLDPRLRDRLGASDVVQDTLTEACARFGEYAQAPRLPFLLWLRLLAGQRLAQLRRFHLEAQVRDARREHPTLPGADVQSAAQLLAREQSSPTQRVVRTELERILVGALERLEPLEREVLVMRHFEELTAEEAARELDISPSAAAKRYQRALESLREAFALSARRPT